MPQVNPNITYLIGYLLMVTFAFLSSRGRTLLRRNIRTAIVLTSIVNLLDIITTYYGSGPGLKYEGNYWVVHHGFGWPGLLLMLLLWQWFTIVLYGYHKNGFGPVHYRSSGFRHLIAGYFFRNHAPKPFRIGILNKIVSVLSAVVSFYGLWSLYWYVANKSFIFFNNLMLSFVHNNAVVTSIPGKNLIEITLNDHPLWQTFVKDVVIEYYHLSVNANRLVPNIIYWIVTTTVFLVLLLCEYQKASRAKSGILASVARMQES